MNILFLSRWFPFPPDNGSKLRIYRLLSGLSKFHNITLLSFVEQPFADSQALSTQFCSRVEVITWRPYNPGSLKAKLGILGSSPRFISDTHSPEMEMLIRRVVSEEKYDLVIASQLSMAAYYHSFRHIPALFEEIELGLFYDQAANAGNIFKRLRYSLTWFKLNRYLSQLLNSFQACTVVSQQEHQLLTKNLPKHQGKVEVIPNCVDIVDYSGLQLTQPEPDQLIFSGSFRYYVNHDAMVWFVREVYPIIIKFNPQIRLVITGDHGDLPLPSTTNVTLTGYVDDVKPLIASSSVSLAPIWSGGGTRLKILEAMAIGTPVVATTKGAEGLDVRAGEHLLIADTADAFADCVIRILVDKDLRDRLVKNASLLIKEKYDWSAVAPRFLRLVERIAAD